MITSAGRDVINRYLGRQVSRIAGHIALGVGSAAESVNDTRLEYEVLRIPIEFSGADLNNSTVIFKATVLPGTMGVIREAGLVFAEEEVATGRNLGLFTNEPWTNGTYTSTNANVGTTALQIGFAAGETTQAELTDLDLSFDTGSILQFAYYATANLSSVRFRLGSDSSNYFEFVHAGPVAGMNVHDDPVSSATVVGSPSWDSITYMAIRPSGVTDGPGSIYMNGIREHFNLFTMGDVLVTRRVLATPVVLDPDIPTTVEYPLVIV